MISGTLSRWQYNKRYDFYIFFICPVYSERFVASSKVEVMFRLEHRIGNNLRLNDNCWQGSTSGSPLLQICCGTASPQVSVRWANFKNIPWMKSHYLIATIVRLANQIIIENIILYNSKIFDNYCRKSSATEGTDSEHTRTHIKYSSLPF